jgi:5-methylcytosine-specific restriction protein A
MLAAKQELIVRELEEGTGAVIAVAIDNGGLRSGMKIWFDDLDQQHGPVAEIRPHGLKAHRVNLAFGNFSGAVIRQIRQASAEDRQLAMALVASIDQAAGLSIAAQALDDWAVNDGSFRMAATMRHDVRPDSDEAVSHTCREVIVPMMAAMAELIGYDVVEDDAICDEPAFEGAIKPSLVNRRERNPRNRLLCIRLHGETCAACGLEPRRRYGDIAGGIIEVHHLEPLASIANPRPYDPATDLLPLCPSCHRAAHTRRPVPWEVEDIRRMLEEHGG